MPRTYIRRDGERVRGDLRTRIPVPYWIDPYFWIQGSSIEKMVMAELVRRGIYFEHTPQSNPLPWSAWMLREGTRKWEPDFLFPQYRIWLEIQGAYFHTLPGQVETDALRFAYIESVGWKPIAWWEDDIRTRLQDLMNEVPQFYRIDRKLENRLQRTRRAGGFVPLYDDHDLCTLFRWQAHGLASKIIIEWQIPIDEYPGKYRIKYFGDYWEALPKEPKGIVSTSREFLVS